MTSSRSILPGDVWRDKRNMSTRTILSIERNRRGTVECLRYQLSPQGTVWSVMAKSFRCWRAKFGQKV